jgi:hypothetical protein
MATAEKITKTEKTVTVTFSEDEIMAVASALARTTGGRHSPRQHVCNVLNSLQIAGINYRYSSAYGLSSGWVDFKTAS